MKQKTDGPSIKSYGPPLFLKETRINKVGLKRECKNVVKGPKRGETEQTKVGDSCLLKKCCSMSSPQNNFAACLQLGNLCKSFFGQNLCKY